MKEQGTQQHAGFLLVVIWALTSACIWLASEVGPPVIAWLILNEKLSGWAEAFGGMAAVVAAFMVGRMQSNVAIAAERERDRQHRLRHLVAVNLAFNHAHVDVLRIDSINIALQGAPEEAVRSALAIERDLAVAPPHELPGVFAHQVSNLRAGLLQFAAAVQRTKIWTPELIGQFHSDAKLTARLAARGAATSSAAIGRIATSEELTEERQSQLELSAYQAAIDGAARHHAASLIERNSR